MNTAKETSLSAHPRTTWCSFTKRDGVWFWRDEYCEEPMGPFDSQEEAENDFRELRAELGALLSSDRSE